MASTPPRPPIVAGSPRARNSGGAAMASSPRTVEEIYNDFAGRREGIVRALSSEVDQFYRLCDPERENLCLYGYPDETWEVNLPAEEVPPELPEPALGINFARDGMSRSDWISLVAVHSDAWLLAVAFYYGARFDKDKRNLLFQKINSLPTVFEVITSKKVGRQVLKPLPAETAVSYKAKKETKAVSKPADDVPDDEEEEEEEEEEGDDEQGGDTVCGICGGQYGTDEFWIGCDICEKWYHGQCVKITPAKAESIKQYKCPSCAKKPRVS